MSCLHLNRGVVFNSLLACASLGFAGCIDPLGSLNLDGMFDGVELEFSSGGADSTPSSSTCPSAPATIAVGDRVEGTLDSADSSSGIRGDGFYHESFILSLSAGQTVTLRASSGDADLVMYLLDGDCNEVAFSDDYEGINPKVTYTAEADARITVVLSTYSAGESGAFVLEAVAGNGLVCPTAERELMLGVAIEGELMEGDSEEGPRGSGYYLDAFSFHSEAGNGNVFSMRSSDMDTYVQILDANCQVVAENDDYDGTNSMVNFQPTEAGDFIALATTFYMYDTGAYSLTYDREEADGCAESEATVSIGDSVSGALTRDDDHWGSRGYGYYYDAYSLTLQPGIQYAVDLSSSAFDAYLMAENVDCVVIDQNDDYDGLNSRLVLSSDVETTISLIAGSLTSSMFGDYSIQVSEYTGEPEPEPTICFEGTDGQVRSPSRLAGSLETSDDLSAGWYYDAYTVSLREGEQLSALLVSHRMDTTLRIQAPDCSSVWYNDDYFDLNSYIMFRAPVAGDFVVVTSSFSEGQEGNYELTLRHVAQSAPERQMSPGLVRRAVKKGFDGEKLSGIGKE